MATLAARERVATARLIASLAELENRRLYLGEGCSSLFIYCTERLHLSEDAAYNRVEVAKAAIQYPVILELLANGSVTVTTVGLLAKQLTVENHQALLAAAVHKSKRQVEQQVAALRPQPDVPSMIRKLPSPADAAQEHSCDAAPRRPIVAPLAPERFKVQFTIGRETHERLRAVQDLLRHVVPNGDPAVIFERGLVLLLADLKRKKLAQASRPRRAHEAERHTRHIPASVKREVWARDGGQCAFIGAGGRCTERGFLEVHHVAPFADGGQATASNLQLLCRAHNAYEAERHFGWGWVREVPPMFSWCRPQHE